MQAICQMNQTRPAAARHHKQQKISFWSFLTPPFMGWNGATWSICGKLVD
jgi:acetyl-CoA carboxylase beta subunit